MNTLKKIEADLNAFLKIDEIPDYPDAYNGLQVENNGEITQVASAVDASLKTIREAAELGIDLLVVHHGLYWQGVEMLKGAWREKVKLLLENNIALYSAHIPLDIHPEVGNNVLLAKAIGLSNFTTCLPWKGVNLCVKGDLNKTSKKLIECLEAKLGEIPFSCLEGPDFIEELYIITGGAGSQIKVVNEIGGTNFLSGEGNHWNIPYAEENKMNYFLATHYLTETFGVDALATRIKQKYSLKKHEKISANKFL